MLAGQGAWSRDMWPSSGQSKITISMSHRSFWVTRLGAGLGGSDRGGQREWERGGEMPLDRGGETRPQRAPELEAWRGGPFTHPDTTSASPSCP